MKRVFRFKKGTWTNDKVDQAGDFIYFTIGGIIAKKNYKLTITIEEEQR